MREAAASLLPFLRQPEKHQRKSRCSQRSPPGENKKPRRGARRVAMRPLRMFVRLARRKNTRVDNQKRLWILTFFLRANYHVQGSQYAEPTGADMQRVSTAFVGQGSAASSPATAKLKGRARATNDPASVPLASSHRAQSRRR